jgi:two-component system, sensor histidine kinase and response regulator
MIDDPLLARPRAASEDDPLAQALLMRHYKRVATRTDRLFAWLLTAEWIAVSVTAFVISPRLWSGSESTLHPHILVTLILGGLFAFGPMIVAWLLPGQALTRHVIAIGQLLMTGLIIHVSGGRPETHFLIFGSLAFLGFYRDWRVLVTASVIAVGDHFVRGVFLPESVYGVAASAVWRTVEHVAWILFADVFLITSCVQTMSEMRKVALKRALLERTTESIEATVISRTRELQASQELFQAFMRHTPTVAFIVDETNHGVWLNRSAEEVYGITTANWNGKPLEDVFGMELASAMHNVVAEVLRTNQPVHADRTMQTTRGERHFATTRFPILDSAGRRFVAGTAIDVTEQLEQARELAKARDAAVQTTRLKSEFLANMSHEIRTPMNGIVGLSHLLLEQNLNAEQRDYAETIVSSANALLTIINDILDFSKIEAGKLSFDDVPFDVKEAVEETIELLAPAARTKELELVVDMAKDCPAGVRGDPGRLRQVLTNLLGNAIKFTETGEVKVALSGHSNGATALLRFDIWDSGIGISESGLTRLFNTFTQADGSTTRKYGGSGLGLVIAKQLVQQMHGDIGVTSTLGVGSHFWFTVELEQLPVVVPSPESSLDGTRMLIVDDNPTNRLVLERQLSSWGVVHASAANGLDALKQLANGEVPDVVILDVQMPEMDGVTATRHIRAQRTLDGCRIVLLSSSASVLTPDEMRREGVDASLLKPVRKSKLLETLSRVLAHPGRAPSAHVERSPVEISGETTNPVRLRILVAEDNVVNQKVVRAQLKKLGFTADVVANGREAVDAFERIPYDVILMDCQMPEMDGFDASRAIRERERQSGARPIRIIALTANAMESDRERCLAVGMNDYLSKPVKVEDLSTALLAQSRAETAVA